MVSRNDRLSTKSMFRLRKCDSLLHFTRFGFKDKCRNDRLSTKSMFRLWKCELLLFFCLFWIYDEQRNRVWWYDLHLELIFWPKKWFELGPAGPRDLNDAILEPARETLRGKLLLQKWSTSLMMALMPLILMLNKLYTVYDNLKQEKCFGFGGLVWLKFWHWDTGHSLFVVWMSLEQQNVLFDHATLQKPQSSFRDKISHIW